MKKILFALTIALLVLASYVSAVPTQVSRGNTTLKLLSNTETCIGNCEAWLEWDLTSRATDVWLPNEPDSYFSFELEKIDIRQPGLKNFGIEVYEKLPTEYPKYCLIDIGTEYPTKDLNAFYSTCESIGCKDSKTPGFCTCPLYENQQCGTRTEYTWKKVADSFYGFKAQAGKTYRLRVYGTKTPQLGQNNIDWIPTFFGGKISEWAWWNSDYQNRRQITLTPTADLNTGYPLDINHEVFDWSQCVTDEKCQPDYDDVAIVCNEVEMPRHFEIGGGTPDYNAIWWPNHTYQQIAVVNPDCYLYYNYAGAGAYVETYDANLMATDDDTDWLMYRFEENAANTSVYDYSGQGRDGTSANNTSTMDWNGFFQNGFESNGASDYITYPNPTSNNGTIEFFINLKKAASGTKAITGLFNAPGAGRWYIYYSISAALNHCGSGAGTCWRPEFATGAAVDIKPAVFPLKTGTWYHVAVTWGQATDTRIYIDGNLWATGAAATLVNPGDDPVFFARRRQDTAGYDDYGLMYLDEVRISDHQRDSFYTHYPSSPYQGDTAGSIELAPGLALGGEEINETPDINGWRVDGYTPWNPETPFPEFEYLSDGNLTIDFNVSQPTNERMTVDINYSQTAVQGTGTPIVNDLNLTSGVCPSQDWDGNFANCSWDWNIALVPDANYYLLFEVIDESLNNDFNALNNSFRIKTRTIDIEFRDENSFLPIPSVIVGFNGSEYTADADGKWSLSIGGLSGKYTLSAKTSDGNYGTRFFEFDLNALDSIDTNVMLLQDANGIDFNFQWHASDGTTPLNQYTVYAFYKDNNMCGKVTTTSNGYASFFLNPDSNYSFVAYKSGQTTQYYGTTTVNSLIPKDEDTLGLITPYSLLISGLANRKWTNQTAAIPTYIFPNTTSAYIFDYNAGINYYTRQYEVALKGNPLTYSLQPYLVKAADSGDFIFNVTDSQNITPLEGVTIVVKRTIPGTGTVTVHEITTDSAGKATVSLLLGIDYDVYFYYAGNLEYTATIRPTTASLFYQVALDVSEYTTPAIITGELIPRYYPLTPWLEITSDGAADINISITLEDKTFLEARTWIIDTNGCVYDINYFTSWANGDTKYYHVDLNTGDANYYFGTQLPCSFDTQLALYAILDVNSTDYNAFKSTSQHWTLVERLQFDLWYRITNIGQDKLFTVDGDGLVSIVAKAFFSTLMILLALGSLAAVGVHDPLPLGLFTCVIVGAFIWIGWIPMVIGAFVIILTMVMALTIKVVF